VGILSRLFILLPKRYDTHFLLFRTGKIEQRKVVSLPPPPPFLPLLLTFVSVKNADECHPLFSVVAEEKVDEFFANCSGSPQSTSSSSCKPASYSQSLSFSLGNYCWQHLLQTSLPSSFTKDISHVQVQEVDAIIDECLSQSNMNKYDILPNGIYPASKTIKQSPLQQSNLLRCAHMHEEDIRYLARVLSNSRPPTGFIHSEPPRKSNVMESALPPHVLFDGSHGKTIFWEPIIGLLFIHLNF
jgi:hypothetical protein